MPSKNDSLIVRIAADITQFVKDIKTVTKLTGKEFKKLETQANQLDIGKRLALGFVQFKKTLVGIRQRLSGVVKQLRLMAVSLVGIIASALALRKIFVP